LSCDGNGNHAAGHFAKRVLTVARRAPCVVRRLGNTVNFINVTQTSMKHVQGWKMEEISACQAKVVDIF